MNRPRMSSAATGLLRALLRKAGVPGDRILLTSWISTDWQSLTFSGERHQACFSVTGADALGTAQRWTDGIEDAEFTLTRGFVGDLVLSAPLAQAEDGSVAVELEALTLDD